MTHNLDPFQMIVETRPEDRVTAFGVGLAGGLTGINVPLSDTIAPNCNGCGSFTFDGYISKFQWDLRAQVQDCAQQGYIFHGQTSGATIELDCRPVLDYGHDCKAISCGGTTRCLLPRADGAYLFVPSLGTDSLNQWILFAGGRHRTQLWLYHFELLSFIDDEIGDVELFTYSLDISLIEDATPSAGVWITVAGHALVVNERMVVAGTVNYDGTYQTAEILGDKVRINTTYVEDESNGTLTPDYD